MKQLQTKNIFVNELGVAFSVYQLDERQMVIHVGYPGMREVSSQKPYFSFTYPGQLKAVQAAYRWYDEDGIRRLGDDILECTFGTNVIRRIKAGLITVREREEVINEMFYPAEP